MPSYPMYLPGTKPNDKVLILEDANDDGKADRCTVFADGLHLPIGIELGDGGVYLSQMPNFMFLKDTNGDDRADTRELIMHGFDTADSHHAMHAYTWDPGGALYWNEGTFHYSQVETPYGPRRCNEAGVFRWEPKSWKFDVFVSYGFANPWGHYFDRWGQNFVADASGGANYYGTAFSGQVVYPQKHGGMKQFFPMQWRPTCGCELVSSRHFPDDTQGDYLLNNDIGFQGILRYRVKEEGSGFAGAPVEPLLRSSDPNFRPVALQFGPDGALYVVDWFNPLIGHMQHSLRDPNRDHTHGRIWRITYPKRPLVEKPRIAGATVPELLDLLKSYEDRTRFRARRELRERPEQEVLSALDKWKNGLNKSDPEYWRQMLEALWLHQSLDDVDMPFLKQLLTCPEPRARAAATRVLCYWRDRIGETLELLRKQVNDEHPRVRLEAIRALSFFDGDQVAKAQEIALESLLYPQDDYLEYTLNETTKTLDQRTKDQGRAGEDMRAVALDRAGTFPPNPSFSTGRRSPPHGHIPCASSHPARGLPLIAPAAQADDPPAPDSPLVKLLKSRRVPEARQGSIVDMIGKRGTAADLDYIFQQAIAPDGFPAPMKVKALEALAEAASNRNLRPAKGLDGLIPVDRPAVPRSESSLETTAVRLAGLWKLESAAEPLRSLAASPSTDDALRALAPRCPGHHRRPGGSFPDRGSVRARPAAGHPDPGGRLAGKTRCRRRGRPGRRDPGSARIPQPRSHAAISRLSPSPEGRGRAGHCDRSSRPSCRLGQAGSAGRLCFGPVRPGAGRRLSRAAGLSSETKPLTPGELSQLVAEVTSHGEPGRGELIFRRADLNCMSCHSLTKAGGDVGPDLSSIGQTSPPDYIINSILDPDQSIKEQYHTLVVQTSEGQVFQGIVTDKDDQRIVLKEATGVPRAVPVASIEDQKAGRLAHAQGSGEPDDPRRVRRPGAVPCRAGKARPLRHPLDAHNSALEGLEAGPRVPFGLAARQGSVPRPGPRGRSGPLAHILRQGRRLITPRGADRPDRRQGALRAGRDPGFELRADPRPA